MEKEEEEEEEERIPLRFFGSSEETEEEFFHERFWGKVRSSLLKLKEPYCLHCHGEMFTL